MIPDDENTVTSRDAVGNWNVLENIVVAALFFKVFVWVKAIER